MPAPTHAPSPTYWGNTHQDVIATNPLHSRATTPPVGGHPHPNTTSNPPTPNLSPHRHQQNNAPSITLIPLPAPLPVSTPPNDALMSNSASVSAHNTSPLHSATHAAHACLQLHPSVSKALASQVLAPPGHPALLNSITNNSTEIDGVDSNLPYLEFVPSSYNSTTTAPTHYPPSPTASSHHARNLMHTPSMNNTPVATPGASPTGSPFQSAAVPHSTTPSSHASPLNSMHAAPAGLYIPNNPGATDTTNDAELPDIIHNTLPAEFHVDAMYSGPLGSETLISDLWGSRTNDLADFRAGVNPTVTNTDSIASNTTPAASVSPAIPQKGPLKGPLDSSSPGELGLGLGLGFPLVSGRGFSGSPGQQLQPPELNVQPSATTLSPAQPFTPTVLGELPPMGGKGSTSGVSSAPPSPNPMLPPQQWQPLASVGGLTTAGVRLVSLQCVRGDL